MDAFPHYYTHVNTVILNDLGEAYAGDTDPHSYRLTSTETKEAREEAPLEGIRKDFPEFEGLAGIIERYEASKKDSGPAQLIYAVDKLLVFANMYSNVDPYYTVLKETRGISIVKDME